MPIVSQRVLTAQQRIDRSGVPCAPPWRIRLPVRVATFRPTCPTCLTPMQERTRRFKCLTCGYSFVMKADSMTGRLMPFWGMRGMRRHGRGKYCSQRDPKPAELRRRNHIMRAYYAPEEHPDA